MPTYVILMNWTDQGARADRDTVRRREHGRRLTGAGAERAGLLGGRLTVRGLIYTHVDNLFP